MSNLGFNYGAMGLRNLAALADTEAERRKFEQEMRALNAKAEGKAIGSLVGSVLGAGKGLYDDYQQGEKDADAARGEQSRKEYGVLTDTNKPAMGRVREVYGDEVADVVAERSQLPVGLRQTMKDKGMLRGAGAMHREMADAVSYEPRVSQTGNLLGGKDTQLVSNDPWRDFLASRQFLNPFISKD